MPTPHIRPIVIGVFRHRGRLLAFEAYEGAKRERFFRPLGGGIHFGERAADALVREIREEIGADIVDIEQLGVLENLFALEGTPGHEIVYVFDARFADESLYDQAKIEVVESNGERLTAVWLAYRDLPADHPPIYPDGLLELLIGL